jgi:hypothetical protein
MRENIVVRSANVGRVLMDGKEVGLCQNIRMSDDYGPEPASGIGDIHVQEYVPTMARHTVTVGKLAMRKQRLIDMGIVPENGEQVLKGNVYDIEVIDKLSGEVLRKCLNCSYASGEIEMGKHAIISYNATFNALDVTGKL